MVWPAVARQGGALDPNSQAEAGGMIVSPGRRYIFVHIPKTGGTSMALALEARAMKDDILIGDTPKARRRKGRLAELPARGRLWKHSRLSDLDGWIGPDDLDDVFVFTLVRNPWDRVVSYYHWLRTQDFDHPAVRLAGSVDFAGFVAHPQTAATLGNDAARHYVSDATGRERCDAFLRLEHLDRDIAPLADHLGFRPDIPDVNTTTRDRDHRRYYDEATAARVAALCAEDIARFGYAF
jgi:hypothetical protein